MSGIEPAVLGWLAAGATAVSTVHTIDQRKKDEQAAKAAGARQANRDAAVAQRAAQEQRRRGEFAISRARALGAASGGKATDPSVLDIIEGLEEDTEFNVRSTLYAGEVSLEDSLLRSREIRRQRRAANDATALTAVSDSVSLYDKYWLS